MASPVSAGGIKERKIYERLRWKAFHVKLALHRLAQVGEMGDKALCAIKDAALMSVKLVESIDKIVDYYEDRADMMTKQCLKFGKKYCGQNVRLIRKFIKLPGKGYIVEFEDDNIYELYPAAYWVKKLKKRLDSALKAAKRKNESLRKLLMAIKNDLDEIEKDLEEEYRWITEFARHVSTEFSKENAHEFAEILKRRIEYIV